MRLASYNIQYGKGKDERFDLDLKQVRPGHKNHLDAAAHPRRILPLPSPDTFPHQ